MNRLPFAEWLKKYGISPLHAAFPDVGGYDYARMWADGVEPVESRLSGDVPSRIAYVKSVPRNSALDFEKIRAMRDASASSMPRFVWPDAYRTR
jgi:hypothetical protein